MEEGGVEVMAVVVGRLDVLMEGGGVGINRQSSA